MGRTPISMLLLRHRLRKLGYITHLFGYSPTFESLERATNRLVRLIHQKIGTKQYAFVGHSLGSVIIRNALPKLGECQPAICFFLAPPMVACKAAKFLSRFRLYRLIAGEMGQLLAQDNFMEQLPFPANTKIYAGTCGPRASWLPFGHELNDCILSVDEATGKVNAAVVTVHSTHTFIMNAEAVVNDMASSLKSLT
jgi:hypothetical protein